MTINSATAGAGWFLNGISNVQQELTITERQLSSGYRVQDASDAPAQTADLVGLESSLAADQAYQSNLTRVQAEASAADTAIGSAISLLDNAKSLAAQADSSALAPASIPNILAQVKQIQQQIVGLANTTVEGRYIFGGERDQSTPYQYDAVTGNVTAVSSSAATRVVANPQGQPVFQSLSAQQIFDPQDATGASTGNSVVAALSSLATALANNDQTGIASAIASLGTSSTWLNQQQGYYGAAEQRLTNEQNSAASRVTDWKTGISGIRDTDVTQAAIDLAAETTDQSAAYGAEATISRKSLFDYLA
jgi:flagellar hook-associated protein 3 FlgL